MAYQHASLATLQTRLAEKYESVPYWTAAEATMAINEALRVWNALTGMWRTRISPVTSPRDPWHPLTGNLTYQVRISYNNSPLPKASLFELDHYRPNWENETTTTGGDVPATPLCWAPAGLQLIAIWPADAVGGTTFTVDGVVSTPVLVNAGDFIDIGDEELSTLLGYALHYLSFKEVAHFKATMPLYQAFIAAALLKNERLKRSNFFRGIEKFDWTRKTRGIVKPPPLEALTGQKVAAE
jgi:hypothetical protein